MRRALTVLVWLASIASLAMAALVTTEFIVMATALDPSDLVTAGTEPWTNALLAAAALAGLVVMMGTSLFLWHTTSFKIVGLALTALEVVGVLWVCATVYADYF